MACKDTLSRELPKRIPLSSPGHPEDSLIGKKYAQQTPWQAALGASLDRGAPTLMKTQLGLGAPNAASGRRPLRAERVESRPFRIGHQNTLAPQTPPRQKRGPGRAPQRIELQEGSGKRDAWRSAAGQAAVGGWRIWRQGKLRSIGEAPRDAHRHVGRGWLPVMSSMRRRPAVGLRRTRRHYRVGTDNCAPDMKR